MVCLPLYQWYLLMKRTTSKAIFFVCALSPIQSHHFDDIIHMYLFFLYLQNLPWVGFLSIVFEHISISCHFKEYNKLVIHLFYCIAHPVNNFMKNKCPCFVYLFCLHFLYSYVLHNCLQCDFHRISYKNHEWLQSHWTHLMLIRPHFSCLPQ